MCRANRIKNIGFISTRLYGTDGVSLETEKWTSVLTRIGYECFFFTGLSDRNPQKTDIAPKAFFGHPQIKKIQEKCFGCIVRDKKITSEIHAIRKNLKKRLYAFTEKFSIQMIIIENALAIPMNIPFGLAITEFIAETGIPAIGHHHDLRWERQRFLTTSVQDYLSMAFPPHLPSIQHVVINSEADRELSYRKGMSSHVIPNVFHYEKEPSGIDDYNKDIRQSLGLSKNDLLFLQPTRIIARKGIEHAIEIVNRLEDNRIKLVITHQICDEGEAYYHRIIDYAKLLDVSLIIKPEIFGQQRGTTADGEKIYSIWDIYPHADLITYPSCYEGFGNAFLEAVYFKKPIVVNRYSIYQEDIEPLGFDVIAMNTYITDEIINRIKDILTDPEQINKMTEKNYQLAKQFFSYSLLEYKLKNIIINIEGVK